MKILIVEDAFCMAMVLRDVLIEAGHQVTCVTGFNSLQPVRALGFDKLESDLDVRQFDLAFCDGQLLGKFKGQDVVEMLTAQGVKAIGMSTAPDFNKAMVEKGAKLAANKAVIIASVFAGHLTLDEAVNPTATAAADLEAYVWNVLFKDKVMKDRLDNAVNHYLDMGQN